MNDFVYIFKFRNGGITLNGAKSKFQTLFQTTIKDKNGNDVNALYNWLNIYNRGLLIYLAEVAGIVNINDKLNNDPYGILQDEFKTQVIAQQSSKLYTFIKIESDL